MLVRPRTLLVALLTGLLLAGCSGIGTEGSTGGYVSGSRFLSVVDEADREPAPVLEGEDLEGQPLSSEEFRGKTLVVNVWGSWCPPCRKEAPVLNAVAREYADRDVQFLGLLVVVGLLLVTGAWDAIVADLQSWAGPFEVAI